MGGQMIVAGAHAQTGPLVRRSDDGGRTTAKMSEPAMRIPNQIVTLHEAVSGLPGVTFVKARRRSSK
jgi:hypothetical protein